MRTRKSWQGAPPWWPEDEGWPPHEGYGYETWATFGRRIFIGVGLAVAAFVLMAVLVGALIATLVAGVTSSSRGAVVVATGFVVIGGVWLVQLVVRRTWRPVRDLTRAAGRLADGDYTARVAAPRSPVLRGAVASFNSMAAQLEEADEQRRRLMSDLGHELRTPLAVIRGEVEALMDGIREADPDQLASLLDEVEVMERLVEDLRVLTLSEAGRLPLHVERADLISIVGEVADAYRPSSEVEVVVEVDDEVPPVDLDPVRIRQALVNLVVNALRAMPQGGRLVLRVGRDGGQARIQVVDTGSGIDSERLPAVFDRFVKSPDSPGSGLGLSIARGLVRAHGGEMAITDTGPDGTTATMWLPI